MCSELRLVRASSLDAALIWKMQITSFADLLTKYQDPDTNPGSEPLSKVQARLAQPFTYYYLALREDIPVGAIRVVDHQDSERSKRIAPLFVLPEYRNRGYAQMAIKIVEEIHGVHGWELDTILSEPGNCHLYEKMGYRRTGRTKRVNDLLTLVYYQK